MSSSIFLCIEDLPMYRSRFDRGECIGEFRAECAKDGTKTTFCRNITELAGPSKQLPRKMLT